MQREAEELQPKEDPHVVKGRAASGDQTAAADLSASFNSDKKPLGDKGKSAFTSLL